MAPTSTTQASELRLSDFKDSLHKKKPMPFPNRSLANGTSKDDSTGKKKDKSKKKHKDKHEKKASKKRAREEDADEGEESASDAEPQPPRSESPTKRRKSEAAQLHAHHTSQGTRAASIATARAKDAPDPADTHFRQQTISLYLPVPPISQSYPLAGICALNLSPLLLTYFEPAKGMILAYDNVRVSEEPPAPTTTTTTTTTSTASASPPPALARTLDIFGVAYVWVTADFTVFAPRPGRPLAGLVNMQTESHVGLVCWNLFSASIERARLPPAWRWVDEAAGGDDGASLVSGGGAAGAGAPQRGEGHFVDGTGVPVEGVLEFRVSEVEPPAHSREEKTFLTLRGTLLEPAAEEKLVKEEREAQRKAREKLIGLGPRKR
jgi:DNA-directed RNA polymerase I subunit RPA43